MYVNTSRPWMSSSMLMNSTSDVVCISPHTGQLTKVYLTLVLLVLLTLLVLPGRMLGSQLV